MSHPGTERPVRLKCSAWIALALVIFFRGSALAQSVTPGLEYQIKAAFLFNFAQFVEWPAHAFATASAPIVIGIVGEDPFGRILDETVKGEVVRTRKFEVRRQVSLQDAQKCHILFISQSEKARVAQIATELAKRPILTVSEIEGFCQMGGMIRMHVHDKRVRFQANPQAAERSGLRMSSKLLRLAEIINTESPKLEP